MAADEAGGAGDERPQRCRGGPPATDVGRGRDPPAEARHRRGDVLGRGDDLLERGGEAAHLVLGDRPAAGRALTTFMRWPATWQRIRCSWNSGTVTSWAKSPGCARSTAPQTERRGPARAARARSPTSARARARRGRPRSARPAASVSSSSRSPSRSRSLDEALALEHPQRGKPGRRGEVVAAERRAVADAALHAVEDAHP